MTALPDTHRFSSKDLELPVTWQTMNEVHIPLLFALRKLGKHVLIQVGVFIPAIFGFFVAIEVTFLPVMHALKPYEPAPDVRASIYIAGVVLVIWMLSRLGFKQRVHRMLFLMHLTLALLWSLETTFAFG